MRPSVAVRYDACREILHCGEEGRAHLIWDLRVGKYACSIKIDSFQGSYERTARAGRGTGAADWGKKWLQERVTCDAIEEPWFGAEVTSVEDSAS